MNKKNIITIVLVIAVIGVYCFVKYSKAPAQVNSLTEINSTTVVRKKISREELLNADWKIDYKTTLLFENVDWRRFGNYEMKLDKKNPPHDTVFVRNADTQQELVRFSLSSIFFPPSSDGVIKDENSSNVSGVDVVENSFTGKLYAFVTFGNSHGGGFRRVYESDIYGKNARELELEKGGYTSPFGYRFSPDYTMLSYESNETKYLSSTSDTGAQVGATKMYFHIIDLLDTSRSIKFLIPNSPKSSFTGETNWIAGWRLVDENTVEFTRYLSTGDEGDGYTQIADKELWSYDRTTGKSTLLETIPFKK